MSGPEAVVEAAEQEPEEYSRLVEQMDRSGKVTGAYRRRTVFKQAKELDAAPPVLPTEPFHVIVADPPWRWTKKTVHKHARREHHRQRQLQTPFLIHRSGNIIGNDVTHEDDCQGTKLRDVPKLNSLSAHGMTAAGQVNRFHFCLETIDQMRE